MTERLLNGEEIPDIKNDVMIASALKGRGLGLYGDFIFGEYNRYGHTFTQSLTGSAFSIADDIAGIYSSLKDGNVEKAEESASLMMHRYIPGRNIFYLAPALRAGGVNQEWIDKNLNAKKVK